MIFFLFLFFFFFFLFFFFFFIFYIFFFFFFLSCHREAESSDKLSGRLACATLSGGPPQRFFSVHLVVDVEAHPCHFTITPSLLRKAVARVSTHRYCPSKAPLAVLQAQRESTVARVGEERVLTAPTSSG
jgi:hypothetical protein